jgi:hypothetical protein
MYFITCQDRQIDALYPLLVKRSEIIPITYLVWNTSKTRYISSIYAEISDWKFTPGVKSDLSSGVLTNILIADCIRVELFSQKVVGSEVSCDPTTSLTELAGPMRKSPKLISNWLINTVCTSEDKLPIYQTNRLVYFSYYSTVEAI